MALVAKKGEQSTRQQAGGEMVAPRPAYATGTVHHDAVLEDGSVVHHHQVFETGRLVSWERDDEPGPWALVRTGDPFVPCQRGTATTDQLDSVTIRLGETTVPLPPLDDSEEPRWAEVPSVPDATAQLRYELIHSPLGTLRVDVRYEDGKRSVCRIVDDWVEPVEGDPAYGAPEMAITMTWRNYLLMRAGRLTALEAIEEGGTVDARWTLLLLLHGLLQQNEFTEIYRSLPVVPDEIGWWGEVAPWVDERSSF